MVVPECRPLWRGIEGADSIVINPHKWLGAAFDCTVYYVREPADLIRVMSTNPSYLQTSADRAVISAVPAGPGAVQTTTSSGSAPGRETSDTCGGCSPLTRAPPAAEFTRTGAENVAPASRLTAA